YVVAPRPSSQRLKLWSATRRRRPPSPRPPARAGPRRPLLRAERTSRPRRGAAHGPRPARLARARGGAGREQAMVAEPRAARVQRDNEHVVFLELLQDPHRAGGAREQVGERAVDALEDRG